MPSIRPPPAAPAGFPEGGWRLLGARAALAADLCLDPEAAPPPAAPARPVRGAEGVRRWVPAPPPRRAPHQQMVLRPPHPRGCGAPADRTWPGSALPPAAAPGPRVPHCLGDAGTGAGQDGREPRYGRATCPGGRRLLVEVRGLPGKRLLTERMSDSEGRSLRLPGLPAAATDSRPGATTSGPELTTAAACTSAVRRAPFVPEAETEGWPRHGGRRRCHQTVLFFPSPMRTFPHQALLLPPLFFPGRWSDTDGPGGRRERATGGSIPRAPVLRSARRPSFEDRPSPSSGQGAPSLQRQGSGVQAAPSPWRSLELTLPSGRVWVFFRGDCPPSPPPFPNQDRSSLPYRLCRSCSRRPSRAVLAGPRPPVPLPSSPVSRCPDSIPVSRAVGAENVLRSRRKAKARCWRGCGTAAGPELRGLNQEPPLTFKKLKMSGACIS